MTSRTINYSLTGRLFKNNALKEKCMFVPEGIKNSKLFQKR